MKAFVYMYALKCCVPSVREREGERDRESERERETERKRETFKIYK